MQNMFQKLAIAAVLSIGLSSSLMANDDLLAMAINNSTDISGAKMLSQDEMKDIVGGFYYLGNYVSTGLAQVFGKADTTYQGKTMYVIAEKYGATTSSGYSVYLTDNPNGKLVFTSRGYKYQFNEFYITNSQAYSVLAAEINPALARLSQYKPTSIR
jgi:hypothetical protein